MTDSTKSLPAIENKNVLDRLMRVVQRSNDFTLAFVKCNHLAQREELRQALLVRLSDKRVLEIFLDKPIVSLLDEIIVRWDAINPPNVVCVYGLENSINEQREASPVLGRLNNDRDLLRKAVPVSLLIWLPDYALDFLARGAPDFWAWRSGVYEFETDKALWQMELNAALASDAPALFSLSAEDKQKEIARLEELLRTARELPKIGASEQESFANLLGLLSLLYYSIGDLNKARDLSNARLKDYQNLGDKNGIANTYYQLGLIEQAKGNLSEATNLYQKGLQLIKELGDKSGVSRILHNLAAIQQAQGNLSEAKQFYEESLRLTEELGNKSGIASTLHNLAAIQQAQGNLSEAMRRYEESLKLIKELGNKSGIASTLHNLAAIQQAQGNLSEAMRLCEESLQLKQELGDIKGIAISLGLMGGLLEEQGQLDQALKNYMQAWMLFRQLDSPYLELALRDILQIRKKAGEEWFQSCIRSIFGRQSSQIIDELETKAECNHSV